MANRRADDGLLARRMLGFGALADERSSGRIARPIRGTSGISLSTGGREHAAA